MLLKKRKKNMPLHQRKQDKNDSKMVVKRDKNPKKETKTNSRGAIFYLLMASKDCRQAHKPAEVMMLSRGLVYIRPLKL